MGGVHGGCRACVALHRWTTCSWGSLKRCAGCSLHKCTIGCWGPVAEGARVALQRCSQLHVIEYIEYMKAVQQRCMRLCRGCTICVEVLWEEMCISGALSGAMSDCQVYVVLTSSMNYVITCSEAGHCTAVVPSNVALMALV